MSTGIRSQDLCQLDGTSVLIDGAHPGDQDGSPGHPSIPDQLAVKLGQQPPLTVDLVIVTHAHQDHIGCLPSLVADDLLRARWALVADPHLGWGRPVSDDPPADPPDSPANRLVAGLREELLSADTDDDTVAQFLLDALNLEQRYVRMLDTLEQRGTNVVRFKGIEPQAPLDPDVQSVVDEFGSIGLQILGPTKSQLVVCAEAIANATDSAAAAVDDLLRADAALDDVAAYRNLVGAGLDALDARDRPGPAVNLESIVTSFDCDGVKLLFAGDMQFADPQRPEPALRAEMQALRERIAQAAPFHLAKISHHGSDNAFSAETLGELGETPLFGICAGESSTAHPNRDVLKLLDDERDRLKWVRTDLNGLSTISFSGGAPSVDISTGRVSDPTPHTPDIRAPEPVVARTERMVAPEPARVTSARIREHVEVVTRLPHVATRVRVTIDVEPGGEASPTAVRAPEQGADELRIASGRALPPLLFVTSSDALGANLGVAETERLLQSFEREGLRLYDGLPGSPLDAAGAEELVHDQLRLHPDVQGVVLVGGYDVIPSRSVDCLPRALREQLGQTSDPDDFIVWSDDGYGDLDGGLMPDLPVSRIPDGRSPGLVFAALAAAGNGSRAASRSGVINVARPFAAPIFAALAGQEAILVSEPATYDQEPAFVLDGDHVYLMLHGDFLDSSRFWGEGTTGNREAVNLRNIPSPSGKVVFTGCCWGALTVDQPAVRALAHIPPAQKAPGASIALTFLQNGATAFVGCTGAHYSPTDPPYDYFGGPMHAAFWRRLRGSRPAKALFDAKIDYVRGFPHGRNTPLQQAIEYKILRQYTCLGLGW